MRRYHLHSENVFFLIIMALFNEAVLLYQDSLTFFRGSSQLQRHTTCVPTFGRPTMFFLNFVLPNVFLS